MKGKQRFFQIGILLVMVCISLLLGVTYGALRTKESRLAETKEELAGMIVDHLNDNFDSSYEALQKKRDEGNTYLEIRPLVEMVGDELDAYERILRSEGEESAEKDKLSREFSDGSLKLHSLLNAYLNLVQIQESINYPEKTGELEECYQGLFPYFEIVFDWTKQVGFPVDAGSAELERRMLSLAEADRGGEIQLRCLDVGKLSNRRLSGAS